MIALGGGWDELLRPLFEDERYKKIREFLKREYGSHIVYPDMYDLYNCFRFTPLCKLKAVILGQDPYHEPGGWAWFTDSVIKLISENTEHAVFILWGGNARSKRALIDRGRHLVLESAHPSPLSAYNGFFGSRPFSRCNAYLKEHGKGPIDWDLNT